MLSKLPTLSKPSIRRGPNSHFTSLPAPSTVTFNRRHVNQGERDRNKTATGSSLTGVVGFIPKTPFDSCSRSASPHGSFIPQPRCGVVARGKGSLEKNQSRPSSSSSYLPVKSISSVTLRNSPDGAGISGPGNKHATYTCKPKLDKTKQLYSKEKAREKSSVMLKSINSSGDNCNYPANFCSDPKTKSSSDGSKLVPVTLVPSYATYTSSISTQEVTENVDVATKSLIKRTPGGVKQTVAKPTARERKVTAVSRLSQSKAGDETRLNQSKTSSNNLFHRGESLSNGSLSRPKPKDGKCDRSQRGYRTDVSKQSQPCKNNHPDNPVRQPKNSNFTPRVERATKKTTSGSVGSLMGSVGSDDVDDNIQLRSQEMCKNSIPKPTAAVKGTSKPSKDTPKNRESSGDDGDDLQFLKSVTSQDAHAPMNVYRDGLYIQKSRSENILRQRVDSLSLSKSVGTKEGSQGTITVAKVSPIMNANISTTIKGKTVRLGDRRPDISNESLPTGQMGSRNGVSQREVNQLLDSSSTNKNSDALKSGALELIPSVEDMTDIKNTISYDKNYFNEIEGPCPDTEATFDEEADDVIVSIKPMQPITRVSTYSYMSGLGTFSSTHNFSNKLHSSGLRYFSNINGSGRGRLGLSKQALMSEDCTSFYGNFTKRTFLTNKMISDVEYSTDAESVDLAAGYMSDGDVLKPGLIYRADDIGAGYMSEGGASFYGRNISSKMKDDITILSKTINVNQDDRNVNAFPLRSQFKTSLDDSSSASSGVSDTIAEFGTDDNMTGSSISSEMNMFGNLKKTQREELPSTYVLPSSVRKDKSSSSWKGSGTGTKEGTSGKSNNVKKTDSSMQTESSTFQQMSSAAWKNYLQQQRHHFSGCREGRSSHDRVRNVEIEVGRLREKKPCSSGSSGRKNNVLNGSVEKFNGSDGHRSKQNILTTRSEDGQQRTLMETCDGHRSKQNILTTRSEDGQQRTLMETCDGHRSKQNILTTRSENGQQRTLMETCDGHRSKQNILTTRSEDGQQRTLMETFDGHRSKQNILTTRSEDGQQRTLMDTCDGHRSKQNILTSRSEDGQQRTLIETCDGHRSKQNILTTRSEDGQQRTLMETCEKLYYRGRSPSPKPPKNSPDNLGQNSSEIRKIRGSRQLAISGATVGNDNIKGRTTVSSTNSNGGKTNSSVEFGGIESANLNELVEISNSFRSRPDPSNIPLDCTPSGQKDCTPITGVKRSERKTKVKVSANTQTNSHDFYMFGSSAYSENEYNSLGRKTAKNYAIMSPTLSLRERVYSGNRAGVSGASTPSSDYVMLPGGHHHSFPKERSQYNPRLFSSLKHGDGDTGNYVTLDHHKVLSTLQSSSASPYVGLRYCGGSTSGTIYSAPVTRKLNSGSLTETESMESLSSTSSGVHGQVASRYKFPLSPVNPLAPSLCASLSHSNIRGANTVSPNMGVPLSKLSNKDDEMHGSSLSLASTTSSLYLTTDEKYAHEIKKLRRKLEQANEKVATLTSQLTTNAHLVAAFEQSLTNMTGRLQHLTASAEQKDSQLEELRNTIDALKKQSAEAGLTKMALQSMQAVQRTMQSKMSRQMSTDSVSSVNSQSSAYSGSSISSDITGSKGKKKKKGWLRSSFSKAFSRSKKNKNGSVSDVEDSRHIQSDSSTPNSPLLGPHPISNGALEQPLISSHSSSVIYEKDKENAPEVVKDLKKQLREKDMILTDIRLEALTSAHQLESLKDTVNKMKAEMVNLKQDNERLQQLVVSKSLNSSQSLEPFRTSLENTEKRISAPEYSNTTNVDMYLTDAAISREGKRVIISTYLCCHGDYHKVTTLPEPPQEVVIGSVLVNGSTKWDLLDNIVKKAFKEYVFRLDPVSSLGLNAESVLSYHIGDVLRSKDVEIPELLPYGYLVGENVQICITLKGTKQNSTDALAVEMLIPKSIVQRYVSLLSEHRRIILCGPSGTRKTHLAQKLAEFLVFRSGKELSPGAIATFSVDHKSAKELQQYLFNIAEQCESSNSSDLPTVIILDNLHHVGSLGEVFNGFLCVKYQNSPYIIGTMNQTTCSTTNLQLHHNFRWVLCANHMEPVKGFLGRFLRRKLVETEVTSGIQNPDLVKIIDWVPKVWIHLNTFLETHSSSDVTIGPRLFLSCPIDVSGSQVWFIDLWNYSIIPYIMEAVREGLQLYGRRAPWEDPTEWVQESYPWPSIGEPDWPQLLHLRPEDVGYESHPVSSVGTKTTTVLCSDLEADPLLNMLMRLQEAASYSSPNNNDTDDMNVDNVGIRTKDLLNTELESTL
ncbi:uncharacterized protein LOC143244168 isoform X2 [Tachypleus tridentatus]|uniref:uncharacterized protein LOC143244168 isoform X2 n=1 Tax=Tachypleus tridentatus TaxID=6853 RepID=UPI003FD2D112